MPRRLCWTAALAGALLCLPFTAATAILAGRVRPVVVQELPNATEALGGFGFPDPSGRRLLLIPKLARPELLKTALCSGSPRAVGVRFQRRQAETANNGRANSSNFDKLAGNVFSISGARVDRDEICFLAGDAMPAGTAVRILAPNGPGGCATSSRFAALRDRPVVHCWPLARLGPGNEVLLLEFERRGQDAMLSIVVVDGARTMFADDHAEYHGPGESLWRVDDGGVLSPDGFTVVCALKRGAWYALGTAWAGAEGRLLLLWVSEGGDRFTRVISDYWYQAPT